MMGISTNSDNPAGAERIAGLYAVPPGQDAALPQSLIAKAGALLKAAKVAGDADAFMKAGWSFVEDGTADDSWLGVYRLKNGHLGLAGKILNVKFSADVSAAEIEKLLAKFDLRKRRQLSFGTNLMTVEMEKATDVDPFRTSAKLATDPLVEWSEPVVLEQTGHRGADSRAA